jgi:hypothetical protein
MANCQFEAAWEHAEFPVFDFEVGFFGADGADADFGLFGAAAGMVVVSSRGCLNQYPSLSLSFIPQLHYFFGAAFFIGFLVDGAGGFFFAIGSVPCTHVGIDQNVESGRSYGRSNSHGHRRHQASRHVAKLCRLLTISRCVIFD